MPPYAAYIFFGVCVAGIAFLLIIRHRLSKQGTVRHVRAQLIHTEKEMVEFQDPQGNTISRPVRMTLTFQLEDGSELSFPMDKDFRGKATEKQWGVLEYCNGQLYTFTCPAASSGINGICIPASHSSPNLPAAKNNFSFRPAFCMKGGLFFFA